MSRRTLVITLGQLRAHQLTWSNFKENVLDQLEADLAVCVPDDAFFDRTNPFYVNARFRWLVPDTPDLAGTFDRIQKLLGSSEDWRVLCDVKGSWIGRISQSNQPGAAAILFILRWFMLNHIRSEGLDQVYDRFVITRSDFYYVCPHPPLECLTADSLWIPDGEDYGGLCDRHLVVPAAHLVASCNLIDDLLIRPRQMRDAMIGNANWNIEQVIALHLTRNRLISKIERFPYIMFLVRAPEDPTAWSTGDYVSDVDMVVKYPSELHEASRFRHLIRTNDDWRSYFASRHNSDSLPTRIYTSHGTTLYVDEDTGELRHGPLRGSPDNVFFVGDNFSGRIVHRPSDLVHDTVRLSDRSTSPPVHSTNDAPSLAVCEVERIPMTGKVIRGGPGRLIGLRSGAYLLCAEPDGRLVLDRPQHFEWEQFRLVPDFRQKPADPQYLPYVRMFRRRLRLIGQAGLPASPEPPSGSRKLTLSAIENGISGWYRLKIDSPKGALRQACVEASESPSTPVYRFQSLSAEQHYAGYLFISSNLFISSKLEVIEFLFGLNPQQTDTLAVSLHPITPLEYVWRSLRRGFFRRPRRFLQYYLRPIATILLRPDFPCPPKGRNMTGCPAIDIIVPVYRNAPATKRCIDSILANVQEIRQFTPRLIVINDSPDDQEVNVMLGDLAASHTEIMLLTNTANCGFVKSVNRGLEISCREGRDVILINSDTESFEGTLANLVDAAYSDPRIGFASPRSNNASFCSLPHSLFSATELSPKETYNRWKEISATLPGVHFTPTAIGFYLFIRHDILANLGGLREEFGVGYHEENDLIMRAKKCGYRAVLANRSFAFHAGSASFNLLDIDLDAHKKNNTDKLLAMHPEFGPLIARYISSAHFKAESLLPGLVGHSSGPIKLIIDLSGLDRDHDETHGLALGIVKSLGRSHGNIFELSVLCSTEDFTNLQMDDIGKIVRVEPTNPGKHAIAIRLGPPLDLRHIKLLESLAPINIFGMLDTIAQDCGQHSIAPCLSNLWQHVARHANGLIFISQFSETTFCARFPGARALPMYTRSLPTKVSRHNSAVDASSAVGWDEWVDGMAHFLERSLKEEDLFHRLCNRLHASDRFHDADRKEDAIGAAENLASLLQHEGHQFIESAYLTVLKRPPDPAGFEHHLALLREGIPKIQILVGMKGSPEGKKVDGELEGLREAATKYKSSRLAAIRSLLGFRR